jgi:pimeloyl-ACP methyl ester carboxylesterase
MLPSRRALLLLLLGSVLLLGALAAATVLPRLPALRCLLAFQAEVPDDLEDFAHPPEGFRLLADAERFGVTRAWACAPEGDGPHPVMLFVHGVAPEGIRDGRILRAVRAFARGGFLVVAPEVGGLVDPTVRQGDEVRMLRLLRALAAGELEGAAPGRIGAVGISVGGAALLKVCAAYRAEGGRGLRAVMAIGAPEDVRRPAEDWFSLPNPDPEGGESFTWKRRNAAAFARNFVSRAALAKRFRDNPDRVVLRDWLAETWIPETPPEGLTTEAGRAFASWFLSEPSRWSAQRESVLRDGWDQMRPLSPAAWRKSLRHLRGVAVFLLHGVGDPLVPVAEAERLRAALRVHTAVSLLESRMVAHTTVADVGIGERLAHLAFMDDFLDMVAR